MTMQVPDRIVIMFFTGVVTGMATAIIAMWVRCHCP